MVILGSRRRPSFAVLGVALVLGLAMGVGCGDDTNSPTPGAETPTPTPFTDLHPRLDEPFRLLLNGSAFIDQHGYRITFLRIVSDNRCPIDVTCIVAGEAVVEMAVREAAGSVDQTFTWTLGKESMDPAARSIGDFVIELQGVNPVPGGTPEPPSVDLLVSEALDYPFLSLDATVMPTSLAVGDLFEITTDAGGGGLPQFTLNVNDMSVSIVNHSGEEVQTATSDVVTVMSSSADGSEARWTLRADAQGTLAISLFVTGEVPAGTDGPWVFTHGSASFTIEVVGQ